ncbi:MAG: DUF2071 domain-containing protein, partial [Bacteroidia bacterium]
HTFSIEAQKESITSAIGSDTEYFNSHIWGHSKIKPSGFTQYQVTHPKWEIHEVKNYAIDFDYEKTFGPEFSFLNKYEPESVMLTKGSAVKVGKVNLHK